MSKKSHHLRSRPTHRRAGKVKWCSFLWILTAVTFLTGLGLIAFGFYNRDVSIVKAGGITLASTIGVFGIALVSSIGLSCAICANPVYSSIRSKKHARASKFLGVSYRLGIAIPALCTGKFRCMHCGEKMKLATAKQRPQKKSGIKPRSDRPICSPSVLPSIRSVEEMRGPSGTKLR